MSRRWKVIFDGRNSGSRTSMPTTFSIVGSATSRLTRARPTYPEQPVTATTVIESRQRPAGPHRVQRITAGGRAVLGHRGLETVGPLEVGPHHVQVVGIA